MEGSRHSMSVYWFGFEEWIQCQLMGRIWSELRARQGRLRVLIWDDQSPAPVDKEFRGLF